MVIGPSHITTSAASGVSAAKPTARVLFAGDSGTPASAATSTSSPATPAKSTSKLSPKPTGKSLSWWGTLKALATGLKDKDTQQVAKGFALKYIPDLAMSSLFAVPVFGWAAGVIASPITMFLSSKGEKLIAQSQKKLNESNPLHKAIIHYRSLESEWTAEPNKQHFPDHTGKDTLKLPEFVVTKYNKIIEGVFHGQPSVHEKLRINHEGRSFMFKVVERMVHARQAVRQTWLIGKIFNWMSGIGNGIVSRFKPLQLLFLLPRMGLMSIYFILGRKPKFKLPAR